MISFDGSECTYEGPTELVNGNWVIEFRDYSTRDVALNVSRIGEGHTWQEVLIAVGQHEWPSWLHANVLTKIVPDNQDAREYSLSEDLYSIVCWDRKSNDKWPAGSLKVSAE